MAPTEISMVIDCVENREESGKKMKKTRRGKKKYHGRLALAARAALCEPYSTTCGCGTESVNGKGPVFQPIENINASANNSSSSSCGEPAKRKSDRFLRPVGLFAPENSTQFLIADHDKAIHPIDLDLLADLVSPKKLRSDDGVETEVGYSPDTTSDSLKSSPAYSDIDFEYESPDDIDMCVFLQQDFESALLEAHEDVLMVQTKEELVHRVLNLEQQEQTLEKTLQICKKTPTATRSVNMEEEASDLQELLRELDVLKQENTRLQAERSSSRCSP